MLAVLSPSKRMKQVSNFNSFTNPEFLDISTKIMSKLKKMSGKSVRELFDISDKLAELNINRYSKYTYEHTVENAGPSILTYQGDVYFGLKANQFSDEDLDFAQSNVRIISGLYGILRPLDLIQEYRLEMGIQLAVGRNKNLYQLWSKPITNSLNKVIAQHSHEHLINLASDEYFETIDIKKIKIPVVKIQFRAMRKGRLQFVSFDAKRARGMMVRFMILNRLYEPQELKNFDYEGYYFDKEKSTDLEYWFIR